MSTLSLWLPESVHQGARIYAEKEGISVDQLAATALAEKLAMLAAVDYIQARAVRGSKMKFRDALAAVTGVAPESGDE